MPFKKCPFKTARKADRYVRGQLSATEQRRFERQLRQSVALRKEVHFARQLMLYYEKMANDRDEPKENA